jgi:hypothetical protein
MTHEGSLEGTPAGAPSALPGGLPPDNELWDVHATARFLKRA